MAVQNSTRKWVFIGVGVIAAAALVVFFQNYPPQPKDAAATIGAAQRYHATQITGADVKVSQDELTTWIQSDTFDRIVKDPQARKLFTDAAVISMFNDAARRLEDGALRRADGSAKLDVGGVRKLDDGALKLDSARKLEDGALRLADGSAKLDVGGVRKLDDGALKLDSARKLEDGALRLADGSAKLDVGGVRKLALDNAAIRDALMNQAFCQALSNHALRDALLNQARIADTSGNPQ